MTKFMKTVGTFILIPIAIVLGFNVAFFCCRGVRKPGMTGAREGQPSFKQPLPSGSVTRSPFPFVI